MAPTQVFPSMLASTTSCMCGMPLPLPLPLLPPLLLLLLLTCRSFQASLRARHVAEMYRYR